MKRMHFFSVLVFSAVLMTSYTTSSSKLTNQSNNNELVHNEIIIGEQVWMKENLNVDKFRNGDLIPQVKTKRAWKRANKKKQPAWCYYNNNPNNGETHGKLYNWYAVNDPRGLAPEGWAIPSQAEWQKLVVYLGGNKPAASKIQAANTWRNSNNSSKNSGFNAFPSGYRSISKNDDFMEIDFLSAWWSSLLSENNFSVTYVLDAYKNSIYKTELDMGDGASVRCIIKDPSIDTVTSINIRTRYFSDTPLNLSKYSNLKKISFIRSEVMFTDSYISGLEYLPKLEEIVVKDSEPIKVPRTFSNLKNLRRVSIMSSELSDLSGLRNLPLLEFISLSECYSLEEIPKQFSSLSNLKILILDHNEKLTDISILRKMKNLDEIIIIGCPKISEDQISQIKKALPNTKVVLD